MPLTAFIKSRHVGALDDVRSRSGATVSDDCRRHTPWVIAGATIKRVAVDVSGEPHLDLEKKRSRAFNETGRLDPA